MKPNGVFIEEHGSGFSVTVRFHVGREEEFGQYLAEQVLGTIVASISQPKDESEKAVEAADDASAHRRRRAGSREPAAEEAAQPNPTAASAAPAPTSRRRRAASQEAATSGSAGKAGMTPSPSDKKYSDADLSKAASDAARVVGPVKVMAVLEEFGVAKVNELSGVQRGEFVERMAKLAR